MVLGEIRFKPYLKKTVFIPNKTRFDFQVCIVKSKDSLEYIQILFYIQSKTTLLFKTCEKS